MVERDARSVFALKFFECGFGVGVWRDGSIRPRTGASSPRGEAFDLAYGHSALGDATGEAEASVRIVDGEKSAGVAGGEAAFFEQLLDGTFEFQQADGIGDGGAVFAGAFCDLFLSELKFVDKALERVGLLDRVQIFALKIFYQRHF